jgi:hypothetical protein
LCCLCFSLVHLPREQIAIHAFAPVARDNGETKGDDDAAPLDVAGDIECRNRIIRRPYESVVLRDRPPFQTDVIFSFSCCMAPHIGTGFVRGKVNSFPSRTFSMPSSALSFLSCALPKGRWQWPVSGSSPFRPYRFEASSFLALHGAFHIFAGTATVTGYRSFSLIAPTKQKPSIRDGS